VSSSESQPTPSSPEAGSGAAGTNRIAFSGRIGRRALKPGRYRIVAVARDESGRASTARRAAFRVVR